MNKNLLLKFAEDLRDKGYDKDLVKSKLTKINELKSNQDKSIKLKDYEKGINYIDNLLPTKLVESNRLDNSRNYFTLFQSIISNPANCYLNVKASKVECTSDTHESFTVYKKEYWLNCTLNSYDFIINIIDYYEDDIIVSNDYYISYNGSGNVSGSEYTVVTGSFLTTDAIDFINLIPIYLEDSNLWNWTAGAKYPLTLGQLLRFLCFGISSNESLSIGQVIGAMPYNLIVNSTTIYEIDKNKFKNELFPKIYTDCLRICPNKLVE